MTSRRGIGGLTLALAVRQRGFEPDVYEQAASLAEIGAASRSRRTPPESCGRLGVLDALTAVSTEPSELIYRDGRSGRRIAAHPVHDHLNYQNLWRYQSLCGAPFCGIHRADLQRVLTVTLAGAGL